MIRGGADHYVNRWKQYAKGLKRVGVSSERIPWGYQLLTDASR